jgi:hypothetical protein
MVGHVLCLDEKRNTQKMLVGKPEARNDIEFLNVGGKIISE